MKFNLYLSIFFYANSIFCMRTLQEKYAWPLSKPLVSQDSESMFCNAEEMKPLLNQDLKLIVELGSWLGASTRFILDNAKNATVIAVDHWKGSIEHYAIPIWLNKLPKLYETFLVNCWAYKNRLIPMKTTTLLGLQEIYDAGIKPDLIYLDASHDYDSVTEDLNKSDSLFPESLIVGDDWQWQSVRTAAINFAKKNNYRIKADDSKNFWVLIR